MNDQTILGLQIVILPLINQFVWSVQTRLNISKAVELSFGLNLWPNDCTVSVLLAGKKSLFRFARQWVYFRPILTTSIFHQTHEEGGGELFNLFVPQNLAIVMLPREKRGTYSVIKKCR